VSARPIPPPRPPWREPLVWLVFGIPAITIPAGLVTWWIAAQRADSNVAEDWYKRGMSVNRSLERDARAAAMGLSARITLTGEHDLRLHLTASDPLPGTVAVLLTHPVRAEQDRRLSLDRQPDGSYRIVSPLVNPGHWGFTVEAEDWRLAARRIVLVAGGTVGVASDGRVD